MRLPHGQAGKEIEFSAYAFNEDRVKSETARANYAVPEDAGPVQRRAFLISMGVNAYQYWTGTCTLPLAMPNISRMHSRSGYPNIR